MKNTDLHVKNSTSEMLQCITKDISFRKLVFNCDLGLQKQC